LNALAERVGTGERLELTRDLGVAAAGELGVEPLLVRGEPQLVQPGDLGLSERLVRQVGERRPPPQIESVAQQLRRRRGSCAAGLGDELLEALEVELTRLEAQDVAGRARDDHTRSELPAQLGDEDVDALDDRRGRRLAPELVDQPLGRDHLVRVQEQDGEQRARLDAAERQHAAVGTDLERPEDRELHSLVSPCRH
jgi:hypothetical protein